ncbi:MAG: DinB family protein [Bacteroidetes bacterium]|nr:DinB family protein [Bacteroidota bacterium]MBS1608777.1 DinB family protein [Bacteroidota bacterium]
MKQTIEELENIVQKYKPLFEKISDEQWSAKPSPGKWSKKEELGHLLDSAQSNIRRFIVGQYEDQPYIVYAQDKWVTISNYQHYPLENLIDLWVLLNKHICFILLNTSFENAARLVKTQAVHSIEWLASDYNKHLRHHLHHILEMEPVPYP